MPLVINAKNASLLLTYERGRECSSLKEPPATLVFQETLNEKGCSTSFLVNVTKFLETLHCTIMFKGTLTFALRHSAPFFPQCIWTAAYNYTECGMPSLQKSISSYITVLTNVPIERTMH